MVYKHQVAKILTFCLSKASPSAYSTYRMIMCLGLLFCACVACALRREGWGAVRGYFEVPQW
jgi:hypothetical protein